MLNKKVVNSITLIKKEIRTRYWQENQKLIPKDELILEIINVCE